MTRMAELESAPVTNESYFASAFSRVPEKLKRCSGGSKGAKSQACSAIPCSFPTKGGHRVGGKFAPSVGGPS